MSTRAAIARPTESGFTGVYHHWDGYPSGLGWTLFTLAQPDGPFSGDVERMLTTLIDEHPGGWSTINDKDWSQAPGFHEYSYERGPCDFRLNGKRCRRAAKSHLCQTYGPEWHDEHKKTYPCVPAGDGRDTYALHIGHPYMPSPTYVEPNNPECYCHGDRKEEPWVVTEENAAGSGCEWAYIVKADERLLLIASSYTDIGSEAGEKDVKMVGAFGMGDGNAEWRVVTVISFDDPMTQEMFGTMNGW